MIGIGKEFSLEEIDKIICLYKKGYSFSKISKETGRAKSSIRKKLIDLRVAENKPKKTKLLWEIKEVRKYIVDKEEAKKIKSQSHKTILVKCEVCNTKRKIVVNVLVNNGMPCLCRKNISYPELVFLAVNKYFNLGFEYQKSYEKGRFDFINYDEKIVVEMNGEQHYRDVSNWNNAHHITMISDNKKIDWCKKNGYTLIFIDARKSEFEFIKNNINKCELLPNIKEEHRLEIYEIMKLNERYPIEKIIQDYMRGKSVYELGELYDVSRVTITDILRKQNVSIRGRKSGVICIETGKKYKTIAQAVKDTGISQSSISNCCTGRYKTAGGYHWEYLNKEEIL